ncbi:AAA family ATPase [Streptomyces sp. ID05-04B]|uniref:AAA family ATPase n=1 Tax=Streptomyces sp. ID05-04B TaxID=3028661 RepID=UPI0029C538D0|nr:AAA family ATPase [Streptomyces sp. ID05-04B]MDX5568310.1 AAA family ATPase [Streptomyces sp. ID05-04B]
MTGQHEDLKPAVLPFALIVGQDELKRVLEIAYVMPSVGGVLASGERGTAKSTTVRAFAQMMYHKLPVTLPINATDDRILGGWQMDALLRGEPKKMKGLVEEADGGLLYVDEVNLLDDHVVNIILDVVATGLLVVQRDGLDEAGSPVSFTLVGTMNPEEGGLRPQLLDRFGLLVPVRTELDAAVRRNILLTVLRFEEERKERHSEWLHQGAAADRARRTRLETARRAAHHVVLGAEVADLCARIAIAFEIAGHRGEIVMAQAARAVAALDARTEVDAKDITFVAPYALMHRRPEAAYGDAIRWEAKDQELLDQVAAVAGTGERVHGGP